MVTTPFTTFMVPVDAIPNGALVAHADDMVAFSHSRGPVDGGEMFRIQSELKRHHQRHVEHVDQ